MLPSSEYALVLLLNSDGAEVTTVSGSMVLGSGMDEMTVRSLSISAFAALSCTRISSLGSGIIGIGTGAGAGGGGVGGDCAWTLTLT